MRKVELLEDYRNHKAGEKIEVENNEAHALIDAGKAMLVRSFLDSARNKMVTPQKTKRVKVK